MKNHNFFVQLDGSTRSIPNALGVIDSTVSDKKHVLYKMYDGALVSKTTKEVYFSYRCSPNTPEPPQEASGTSGMKAALNGVPSLNVLDGWWIEGHIEGLTGWSIGDSAENPTGESERTKAALSLYDKLEKVILPLYYHDRDCFIDMMLASPQP